MLKIKNVKVINVSVWDKLVSDTYSKPYRFQQQDGCQPRGIFHLTIPGEYTYDDEMNDEIPFKINGNEMGVKFKVWQDTSIKDVNDAFEKINGEPESYSGQNLLFWERNFYPDIHTVANDLHKRGLIEAGEYSIEIDW